MTEPIETRYLKWAEGIEIPTDADAARLGELLSNNADDAQSHYAYANWLFQNNGGPDAVQHWEKAVKLNPELPLAWRNLGIGYYYVLNDTLAAKGAYERAIKKSTTEEQLAQPQGPQRAAQILAERDRIWRLAKAPPADRLDALEPYINLLHLRDELAATTAALLNRLKRHDETIGFLEDRPGEP